MGGRPDALGKIPIPIVVPIPVVYHRFKPSALADLKKHFGGSNLLSKLRNNVAFHHPYESDMDAAWPAGLSFGGEERKRKTGRESAAKFTPL
jgi:hypothetical protein